MTNPNDLKISLCNRIREIKAICAHFELDFESLSSVGDNGCIGLDMSIIESKVQDLSDSVAGSGSDKKLDVDLTLFPDVDLTLPCISYPGRFDPSSSCFCRLRLPNFMSESIG